MLDNQLSSGIFIPLVLVSEKDSIVGMSQCQTPYNASKAAVKHMAASLGVEWAKEGVRVNAIRYVLIKNKELHTPSNY